MPAARKPGSSPSVAVLAVIVFACLVYGGVGYVVLHFVLKFW